MNFLKGRVNRAVYWLCFAVMVASAVAIGLVMDDTPTAITGVLILLFILRLHDLGRSGWWALSPFAVQVAVAAALSFSELGMLLSAAVLIVFVIALGAIPGRLEANHFGAPPPPGLKGALKPMGR